MILNWIKNLIGTKNQKRKSLLKEFASRIASKRINPTDIQNLLSVMEAKNRVTEELFDFILSQDDLAPIILRYNGDKKTIRNLYDRLILGGAGQWTNGFHVATSSIGYPETLEILLQSFDGESFSYQGYDERNSEIKIVYDLCIHFDKK